jgi:hypothetical protein
MTVKLSRRSYAHARRLIEQGNFVVDERDAWSEHRPSTRAENDFIKQHGFREYGKWYLGIDDSKSENQKGRYKFPYGDFTNVHLCGVLTIESRAGQYRYLEIERAAVHLHGMLEAAKKVATE